MKIDYELRIIKKYFDAILQLKKPFELRHKPIPEGSIVKLVEIDKVIETKNTIDSRLTGRYIIFKSGECRELVKSNRGDFYLEWKINGGDRKYFNKYEYGIKGWKDYDNEPANSDWYDKFCWDYINKKQTYLIEIAEMLEVKDIWKWS